MQKRLIQFMQGKYLLSATTSMMIVAVFVRTYLYYPHILAPAFALLILLVILLFLETQVVQQPRWTWTIYLIAQVSIMIALFLLEPDGDTFSLLLLPACMFVMRHYDHIAGWIWVGIFSLAMALMLFYGHQQYAPALIVIYLAAYILVAAFSVVIKQNQLVQQQLLDANQQLHRYSQQVEDLTAANERNRLARELHDSVTQTIFSMTLLTRSALMLQERDPDQVPEKLTELSGLAQSALKEMRALITQLQPLSISEDGLPAVLNKHIDELNRRHDLQIRLEIQPEPLALNAKQQGEIFRIIQEGLNNIIKHSQTKNALVQLLEEDDLFQAVIADQGRGFNPQSPDQDTLTFGLESMRQRSQELGGELLIESEPGAGTRVICKLPLSKDRNAHGKD